MFMGCPGNQVTVKTFGEEAKRQVAKAFSALLKRKKTSKAYFQLRVKHPVF